MIRLISAFARGLITGLALLSYISGIALADGDATLGKRLYWDGVGADNQPVRGHIQGDVEVSGAQFSCVNCHRPSGFGSSEGGSYVPPITGPILFSERELNRNRLFKELFQEAQPKRYWARVRQPRMRPAYDTQLVGQAIRDGMDSSGNPLAPVMPRYDLSDDDLDNLVAYLKTLSVSIDEGVGQKEIHFATIVSADADPAARQAMIETIEVFFRWMNKATEGNTRNRAFSPNYRSDFIDSYRYWRLHVWELKGAPASWPAQLQSYYARQPVFAVVSGMIADRWAPIANFCDTKRLPCLFPNTELPRTKSAEYGYSFYFSRGLELEAEVAVEYLAAADTPPRRIVQLLLPGPTGKVPAAAFAAAAKVRLPNATVTTIECATNKELIEALTALAGPQAPHAILLWPNDATKALDAIQAVGQPMPQLILPSAALQPSLERLPKNLHDNVVFVHPYEQPGGYHPRSFRLRAWMHTRRLKITHTRLQYQTYYALTLLQYGLTHLIADFHRDYLIEVIEHEAENELNPGTHPTLALGPGQRFASKGAFIVRLKADAKKGYLPLTDWIVP